MHLHGRWVDRLRALVRRNSVAEEIRDEIDFHLQERQREFERRGLSPDDARRAALARFGNPAVIHDRGYDVRGGGLMESILQDVRYAVRLWLKQPGTTAVALLTLVLGIGSTTALFSVVEAALIRPLPYSHPEQLVTIRVDVIDSGRPMRLGPSIGDLRTWRAESTVLSHVGMGRVGGFTPLVVDAGVPERLTVAEASEDFLEAYGISPILGRGIRADDMVKGAPAVALLGYGYWQRGFAGDAAVLGRVIRIENVPTTIVGVLPAGFYARSAVWRPVPSYVNRGSGTPVVGRLKPGVTLEQASRELDRLTVVSAASARGQTARGVVIETLYADETSGYVSTITTLAGAVGLILLIACVNIAGLLLARGSVRHVELAVRASLGAERKRLIRQLLTESVVLAIAGAALGVLAAWATLDSLVAIIPLTLPPNSPASISLPVLAGTAVLALVTVVLFGMAPALRLSRPDGIGVQVSGISRAGTPMPRRLGHLLIAVEVALTIVLVSASGLLIRSFARLTSVDVGYDPTGVLTLEVEPVDRSAAVRIDYYRALTSALQAMPQVVAAGGLDAFALEGGGMFVGMTTDAGASIQGPTRTVLPGYFEAIGVRPTSGRVFTAADRVEGESPVVVNALAAARHFGGNALGQAIRQDDSSPRYFRVVGVVPNLRLGDPDDEVAPEMYVLAGPDTLGQSDAITMVIRLREGASIPYETLRGIATAIGPKVLVGRIRPITDVLGQQVATPRRRTILLGLLGTFGLVLTLVGIFSMTAYAVARRTREIGIRMAFGAAPGDVVWHVVRDTMWPALIGLLVGIGAAFYATRIVAAFLFQTTPHDPGTFAGVAILVALGACLAAWIPARRAARVEPVTALRAE